ncbi:MAG: gamma-glutamyl-gamma-aminobutyrate hydrolase family protein [Anaerolineaceae bacterium]|nr:gamma-glutamyl-gamma-aminobutyrate hydrolase family protein [Anaerolineaceae bacterium]
MSKPLIGITCYRTDLGYYVSRAAVGQAYIDAVLKAGGIPLLVPVGIPEVQLAQLCAGLDGLLLTGGGDIDPACFGELMHPKLRGIDTARDEIEIALTKLVMQTKMPFLAVCRGIQVLNVALGGTLYTHISDQLPGALHHACYPDLPRDLAAHDVKLEEASQLAGIFEAKTVQVNSLHHQGIRDLAAGLRPTGFAPDGLIEAVEVPDHTFGIAVQWHPEAMPQSIQMGALFSAFVDAAKTR